MKGDIEERVEKIRNELRAAESELAMLEGRRQQLDENKKKILAGFKELGIKPKDAPQELERLERKITEWLDQAEAKISDFKGQSENVSGVD